MSEKAPQPVSSDSEYKPKDWLKEHVDEKGLAPEAEDLLTKYSFDNNNTTEVSQAPESTEYTPQSAWLEKHLKDNQIDVSEADALAEKYYNKAPESENGQPAQTDYSPKSEWLENYIKEHPEYSQNELVDKYSNRDERMAVGPEAIKIASNPTVVPNEKQVVSTEDGGKSFSNDQGVLEDEIDLTPDVYTLGVNKINRNFDTHPLDNESEGEGLLSEHPESDSEPTPTPAPTPTTPEVIIPEKIPMIPPSPPNSRDAVPSTQEVSKEDLGVNSNIPEENNSLLGRIHRENRLTTEVVNDIKIDSEVGWFKSNFNKFKIKMGWFEDVSNFSDLNTEVKVDMMYDTFSNDNLIIRKKDEITRIDRKIRQEINNPANERLGRENVDRIDKSIEEAKARGDLNMVRTLTEARNTIVENVVNKRDQLQTEKNALNEQLRWYNERKISIMDNFIASIEIETEKIRQKTNYYENISKLKIINTETNRMQGVIAETDSQIISLKKALASTKNRVDRAEIKSAINEYEFAVNESKSKLSLYEEAGHNLGSFIELTDNRTKRFDGLKDKYVGERDRSKEKIDNGGVVKQIISASKSNSTPSSTPPPLPSSTLKQKQPKSVTTPAVSETTPASAPTFEPSREPESEDVINPEVEKRRGEKLTKLKDEIEKFRQVFKGEKQSASTPSPTIQSVAEKLARSFLVVKEDADFDGKETRLFKDAGAIIVQFLTKAKEDGGVITDNNKEFIKKGSGVFEQISKLK